MNLKETLPEFATSREIFRSLFTMANGISDPVLPLSQIMHWQAVRSTLGVSTPSLDSGRTLIFGGYFYNFSTPALDATEIKAALALADRLGTSQQLIPTVREGVSTEPLTTAGFVQIPWFVESIFDIESNVEADLKRRVGSRRFREINGHWNHAREKYRWDWHTGKDLRENANLVEVIANLHLQNVKKYQHTVNLYPAEVIQELANSALGEHLAVGLRRELDTERAVQTVICLQDKEHCELFVLVHGRDYSHNPSWLNFYCSELYEVYKFAERAGLRTIYLGRGNHDLKRRLGANRFRVLSNWIRVEAKQGREELESLCEVARRTLRLDQVVNANESPTIHVLARKSVKKVSWPFSLNERQKLEKAGFLDLASSTGLRQPDYSCYPDLDHTELKESYVRFLQEDMTRKGHPSPPSISPNQSLFTRGITEAIDLLIRAFCEPGNDRVIVPKPTFPMYEYWANISGIATVPSRLDGENFDQLDLEPIVEAGPKVVFLCTPNNPIGSCISLEQIAVLASRSKGLVVVDEAYGEFAETPSAVTLIHKFPNVVVLRTFSKAWGLAALRCGAVIADAKVIAALRLVQGPFAVPTATQLALVKQLSDTAGVFSAAAATCKERDRVAGALRETAGVDHIYTSSANFLCVKFSDFQSALQKIRNSKILVETAGKDLPGCLRISIGSHADNNRLLSALQATTESDLV
jgi:histidinol-phosphate aminotransferase